MAIGDKIFVADKDTLDAVNTKCTTIQTNTNNLNSRLTSTRAGYLDYLANGTYGLNAIKNAINTVDNNVDSIKTYTTTNNTASKTGILSQKSAYIINMLENTTYGLNAIKTGVNNVNTDGLFPSLTGIGTTIYSRIAAVSTSNFRTTCCAKFIAPVGGTYRMTCTLKSGISTSIQKAKDISTYTTDGTIVLSAERLYNWCEVNESLGDYSDNVRWENIIPTIYNSGDDPANPSENDTITCYFYCNAGEPVVLFANKTISNIVVSYQNR